MLCPRKALFTFISCTCLLQYLLNTQKLKDVAFKHHLTRQANFTIFMFSTTHRGSSFRWPKFHFCEKRNECGMYIHSIRKCELNFISNAKKLDGCIPCTFTLERRKGLWVFSSLTWFLTFLFLVNMKLHLTLILQEKDHESVDPTTKPKGKIYTT